MLFNVCTSVHFGTVAKDIGSLIPFPQLHYTPWLVQSLLYSLLQVIDDHYQSHTQDLLSMRRPLERENMHNSLLRSSNVTLLSTLATGGVYGESRKVRSRP